MAGEEWFRSFMNRNPSLSVRVAQATSLSRATSFNKTNVKAFYDNLQIVMDRHTYEPQDLCCPMYDGPRRFMLPYVRCYLK